MRINAIVPTDSITLRGVLGANLKRFRTQRGLSQEALADKAGVHRTFVGAVERSEINVSLDNIEKLAVAVGVAPSKLFDGYGK